MDASQSQCKDKQKDRGWNGTEGADFPSCLIPIFSSRTHRDLGVDGCYESPKLTRCASGASTNSPDVPQEHLQTSWPSRLLLFYFGPYRLPPKATLVSFLCIYEMAESCTEVLRGILLPLATALSVNMFCHTN